MSTYREKFLVIAQITDFHLRVDGKLYNGDIDTKDKLETCIRHLNRLDPQPDLVLATGDLADEPDEDTYSAMREIFERLKMPIYVIPGNHDDRNMVRRAFSSLGYLPANGPFLHYTIEDYPLRMIGLDTLEKDGEGAEMCADRLHWLDDRLSEQPDRPTFIFMHHQPIMTRMGYIEKNAFPGAAEMGILIRRHQHVEWITCGHLHRPIQLRWGGTTVSIAPSSAFQRTLTLDNNMDKAFINEPPGMLIHMWTPETGIISHISLIGDFGAPYPMREV